jgi:GTP cyclohydrolase II
VSEVKPSVRLLERKVTARIPTLAGEFVLYLYAYDGDVKGHVAMVMGDVKGKCGVLVRLHSECFTGEVLGSSRCDCGEQLSRAMQQIAKEGCGVLIYLRRGGIGLLEKLRAYNLQDQGYDTVDANLLLGHQADGRDYSVAALILRDLGVHSMRLLTNNPLKIESLDRLGISVIGRLPLLPTVNEHNVKYLFTKASRMNHILKINAMMQSNGRPATPAFIKANVIGKLHHLPRIPDD